MTNLWGILQVHPEPNGIHAAIFHAQSPIPIRAFAVHGHAPKGIIRIRYGA